MPRERSRASRRSYSFLLSVHITWLERYTSVVRALYLFHNLTSCTGGTCDQCATAMAPPDKI